MKNTTIILGPPGTGKTTELLNLVDTYLEKNTDPRKIGFVSFTKKSVEEARARAAKRFNKDEKFFYYFRTIHSLAFTQLCMTRNDVMELKHYREIGNLLNITIKGKKTTDCSVEELEKGDQLVFVESLSRMCCEPLEDTYNKMNLDFSIEELILFKNTLDRYKKINLLNDFTDMLEKFYVSGYKPELEVLFVDEAQDLCPLQWRIIEQLTEKSKKTYIAGDDDQAIFRWSGADIDYFVSLPKYHETKVLDQSYRLPKKVHSLALEVIDQVRNRNLKEYKPTTFDGKLEFINSLDDIDLSEGEWLILVRNTFMANEIIEHLRSYGFPYESQWKSSRDIESLKAAFTWEKLRSGKEVLVEEVKEMLSYISQKKYLRTIRGRKSNELINMKVVMSACAFVDPNIKDLPWYDALDRISFEDREYFISARKQGESLIKKPRIKVSTIHGAKGGECKNVVLFLDISSRTYREMMKNFDDEVRVFYVGITRAKENLYIVQPSTNTYFNI